ncbi:cytochrome c [Massilia sp. TS11]|uniref:c-type cytochrome n=1 Tax=Massilia sp. TS11 TaxID=2908003 RepID=UPI001EDC76B1|nr:cytochrome c [Massilia sp. TS11]MCG2584490.1 cytochrome c [Massilia sp. TS11]
MRARLFPMLAGLLAVAILAPAVIIGLDIVREPGAGTRAAPASSDSRALVARGAYLARAGNCMACHTSVGGAAYAGGRAIHTPFGDIYASNLTPDAATGLGAWSADDFWRALHNGKGKDGRFLYPAFPYTNTTKVTREDADALYAYLRSLPPVRQATPAPALAFPFNQRLLLPLWRFLYFTPGEFQPDPARSVAWNRGAYLVQGLGHCNACHTARGALGGSAGRELAGGMIPMLGWHAASLTDRPGLGDPAELAQLLGSGVSARAAVFGPMAEVVRGSLQYLEAADVQAIASYLVSLPPTQPDLPEAPAMTASLQAALARGAALYKNHCASCHQADGSGAAGAYPALAGSRSLREAGATNAVRMVLYGGFPPSTRGNPRPYGMPPFGPNLSDAEVADVVTYVRQQWGVPGVELEARDVQRLRTVPVE